MSDGTASGGGGEGPPGGDVLPEAGEATLRSRIGKDLRAIWANQPLWDMLFSERFDHPRDWVGRDTIPMFEYHGAEASLVAIEKALCTGEPQSVSQRIALLDGCMATSESVWTPYLHRGRPAGVDALTCITVITEPFLDMSEGYWPAMEKLGEMMREYEHLTKPALSLVR